MTEGKMKFEVLVDKHFNVKEIWFGNNKVQFIEGIEIHGTPERTFITFQVLPQGIEFKFWEDKNGTRTKKNMGK